MLATLAPWIMPAVALLGLRDWLGDRITLTLTLDDSPERLARHKAHAWQAAALFLVACTALLRLWGTPPREWAHFFTQPPGLSWLLLAWLCGPLLMAGAAWAERTGGEPFPARLRPTRHAWRKWPWAWLLTCWAGVLGMTWLLAHLSAATPAEDLVARLGLSGLPAWRCAAIALALMTLAPILEEILFRHYLLHRVWHACAGTPAPPMLAAACSALLFGLAHAPLLAPWWIKVAQATVMGALLAATALRYGLEPAIALHWAFNLSLFALLLPRL